MDYKEIQNKIVDVMFSCKTTEQIAVAETWCKRLVDQTIGKKIADNYLNIIQYLQLLDNILYLAEDQKVVK